MSPDCSGRCCGAWTRFRIFFVYFLCLSLSLSPSILDRWAADGRCTDECAWRAPKLKFTHVELNMSSAGRPADCEKTHAPAASRCSQPLASVCPLKARSESLEVRCPAPTTRVSVSTFCVCFFFLWDARKYSRNTQPVAVQAPPPRHQQQAVRQLRRQLQAAAEPCRGSCDVPLLQGSFTGRLGRQVRRPAPFESTIGNSCCLWFTAEGGCCLISRLF